MPLIALFLLVFPSVLKGFMSFISITSIMYQYVQAVLNFQTFDFQTTCTFIPLTPNPSFIHCIETFVHS